MAWHELCLEIDAARVDSVSAALFAQGAAGVQEDFLPGEAPPARQPWDTGPSPALPRRRLLRAWFEDPDVAAVEAAVAAFGEPSWSHVAEVDWEARWREGFEPVAVGDLVVAPPWDAPARALIIEPGRGFGTGAHPTTRQALRALVDLAGDAGTCLDVGCGSGILALAAARLGLRARGVDISEAAIDDARYNAAVNDLDVPFATTPVGEVDGPFDLVLANLYAEALVELAGDLVRLTGRWLVLAGILVDREPLVAAAFSALDLHARQVDGEWACRVYRRPS